jgi:hypothetical protein
MGERKEEITGKEEGLRRRGGSTNGKGGRTNVARRKGLGGKEEGHSGKERNK